MSTTIQNSNTEPVSFPIGEVWDSFMQIGGTFATSVSTLPAKLSEAVVNGVVDFDKAAAALAENYRYYAQQTQAFSQAATLQGSTASAMIYHEWSEIFASRADSLMDSMLSSRQRMDNCVASLNQSIDAMGKVGKYIGPVFDATQMVLAVASGDINEVGATSTGILAAELAGGVAFGVVTTGAAVVFGATAPVWAAVGVAALAAGAANYYGKDIYEFSRPLFDKAGSWIPDSVWKAIDQAGSNVSTIFAKWFIEFNGDPNADIGSGTYDALGNFITSLQSSFHTAEATLSPLVLDLDGDGVETIDKSSGIHFDHDGNHFAETTGWAGKDDGLLAWDKNGNGKIDNGGELFGNNTLLASGAKAANGFAALAELDSNHDGKIDANDTAFTQLRVWKDGDSNAVVADGELLSLAAAGVQSINVSFTSQTQTDAQGNQHLQTGQYTRTDGSTRAVDDVWFGADTARTVDQDLVTVSDAIAALPDLQGFGSVHSLHQAMAHDTSGHLQNLVQDFVNATDSLTRQVVFQQILFAWAGSDQYSANSRGTLDDGRKLYTLEAFLGESFVQIHYANGPGPLASAQLVDTYNILSKTLYGQLIAQTDRLQSLYHNIGLNWNAATGAFDLDVTGVLSSLRSTYAANADAGLELLRDFKVSLASEGSFGNEVLSKLSENWSASDQGFAFDSGTLWYNLTIGSAGNDTVSGLGSTSNFIMGLDGNDSITGWNVADVLDGGAGSDTLNGGLGNDTYMFNLGNGADTIIDYDTTSGNNDKLQFGTGISADAIQLSRSPNGYDLTLSVNGADKVTLTNYFASSTYYRIETIAFADGTTWDVATTLNKPINGTAGADTLWSISDYANRINGLEGNDNITGADKDDVLTGGLGNDTLSGSAGNDTYVFNLGDGADTISDYDTTSGNNDKLQFGAGISADAIQLSRSLNGNDLTLSINGTDKVTLTNHFSFSTYYRIETIAFADGTSWDYATVVNKLVYNGSSGADTLYGLNGYGNRINGLEGNDNIIGADKDDVLTGGPGNDTLSGGTGNDTYMFNLGDGADTISDNDSTSGNNDKLQFGSGISADAIQLSRSLNGNDLTLSVNGTDKVTLAYYFNSSSPYRIETITFADGTSWDYATVVNKLVYNGSSGADYLYGISGYANRINGLQGNDNISGADKDDVLDGGSGNDTISGGAGNDTISGGVGSDSLTGGTGNDIFKFLNPNEGSDSISDFTSGTDVVQLIGSNFGLTPGAGVTLLSGASTPAAVGSVAQFLYNTTTGDLYFDQDGADAAYAAIQIAKLTGQKTLAASDIVVV